VGISTFKGFRRAGKTSTTDLVRSLHTTLEGIAHHTVDGRESELASFRERILDLARQIDEQGSPAEVDSTIASALDLLRDYNERAMKNNDLRNVELKSMMRTMTDTITFLSESRTRSVHQLQFMERELGQASQIDDIRMLRARMVKCLDVIRDETVRLQMESQTRSEEVRQQIHHATRIREPPPRFGSMDSVTGLPGRKAAESAIGEALQGVPHAVCAFVVTRLSAINAKYGRAVGDEVMLNVANHFAQHLSSATHLYRWSGPALVALIQVENDAEEIKRAWSKAAAVKQEISLESNQRSVFVMVETTMSFQLVQKSSLPEDLFFQLDKFVAEHGDCPE